MPEMKPTVAKP